MQHPRAELEHLDIKRENSGNGLIQQELTYKTTTIGLKKYLETTTDWMLQLVDTHEKRKKKYSINQESKKCSNQINLKLKEININKIKQQRQQKM